MRISKQDLDSRAPLRMQCRCKAWLDLMRTQKNAMTKSFRARNIGHVPMSQPAMRTVADVSCSNCGREWHAMLLVSGDVEMHTVAIQRPEPESVVHEESDGKPLCGACRLGDNLASDPDEVTCAGCKIVRRGKDEAESGGSSAFNGVCGQEATCDRWPNCETYPACEPIRAVGQTEAETK